MGRGISGKTGWFVPGSDFDSRLASYRDAGEAEQDNTDFAVRNKLDIDLTAGPGVGTGVGHGCQA